MKGNPVGFSDFTASAEEITAEQLEEDRAVITPNGPRYGKAGGWEVRSKDGNVQYLDDEDFQSRYGSGKSKDAPSLTEEDNRGPSQMNNLQTSSATGTTDSGSIQNESDEKESAREDSKTREDGEDDESKTSTKSSPSSKAAHKDLEDERFPRK